MSSQSSVLADIYKTANDYNVPFEDALFIDFNRKGLAFDGDYPRVRFYFELQDSPFLEESIERDVLQYFLAMPTNSGMTNYTLRNGTVYLDGDIRIGEVRDLKDDSIDAVYPRREATVMNLNPSVKSACRGCDFCYVNLLTANDQEAASKDQETFLELQAEKWMDAYALDDLSSVHQIAVLTGCFGGEDQALSSMRLIRDVFSEYGFDGELFFFGSELQTADGLNQAQELGDFAYCLTLENFGTREDLLKNHKERITLPEAKTTLSHAQSNGFDTQFSYVLGLESLDVFAEKMKEFKQHVTRLPIINIYQPHSPESADLLHENAHSLDYFLEAREIIERIFPPDEYVPRPWENYRSLWYLTYGDHQLTGPRLPERPDGRRMDDQLPN